MRASFRSPARLSLQEVWWVIAVILRAPFWLPMAAILVATLIPVVYSLVFYKRLERRSQLNG